VNRGVGPDDRCIVRTEDFELSFPEEEVAENASKWNEVEQRKANGYQHALYRHGGTCPPSGVDYDG
jgi:hypothetical protein